MTIVGFIKQRQALIITCLLLVILFFVLSFPTIKTRRSVEVKRNNPGVLLRPNESLESSVRVPSGRLEYFVVWINDSVSAEPIEMGDYKAVELGVVAPETKDNRQASRPILIERNDGSALLFYFDALNAKDGQLYKFVLKQTGRASIMMQLPMDDFIKEDESAAVAFEVGERKNWLTLLLDKVYRESLVGKDISMYLHRGTQIINGENPYACTLDKNSCIGYPAHLPGMYLVAAGFAKMGINDLDGWAHVWRPIVFVVWLSVGVVLFLFLYRRGQPVLAVAALGFWLFNRWSIDVLRLASTDFLGTIFLVFSVVLFNYFPMVAAVLLGVSLSIKQLAALIIPLFLITAWRQRKMGYLRFGIFTGLIFLVPMATSLFFLINNPKATIRGLLNVAERPSQVVHGFAPSLDKWLDVPSERSLLMIFLIVAVYIAAWRKEVNLVNGTFIVLAIMMAFSSVLYNQYFVWFIVFIPLVVAGAAKKSFIATNEEEKESGPVL